ncbi:SDR family oxidoreductase [Brevundimonas sp. C11]|uniref:SDR family oxidoreductase n=2 Tax=Brevundimonas TaxID=41275 RepID=A0ABV1NQF3_9CAUL|nr:MAG: oxidoreductase [Brevundimonas subvibrioides]
MPETSARRVALVTGAASGIGRAVSRLLSREGWALALVDRNAAALDALARTLTTAEAVAFAQDVSDDAAWADTESALRERFGGLDGVVVNAGISESGTIADLSFEAWRRVLSVNLDGTFLTLRTGMRLLRDGGAAVVVSSASAVKAEPGVGAYGASKAAVLQLAKVAAREGAARGVRVNAILPGGVETPIWRGMAFFDDLVAETGSEQAAFDRMAGFATPLGHYAKAEEIAGQIAFLLSPGARTMTGASLVVDGGYTL